MLPGFDIDGQYALLNAKVLIAGLGGLGASASLYLAAAGVNHLTIADSDKVELSNLQRQIIYRQSDLGSNKTTAAAKAIRALNSACQVDLLTLRLEGEPLEEAVGRVDLVLDCTDNLNTRIMLNAACWKHKKPLVSAAALGMTGQLTVFNPNVPHSPCYRCLYKQQPLEQDELSCSENGILGPVVGLLGTAQAIEAIKILARFGDPLIGRLLLLDANHMSWHSFRLSQRPDCETCGN